LSGGGSGFKDALKGADEFISHRRYKTTRSQEQDWSKIQSAVGNGDLTLPRTVGNLPPYADLDEYLDTVRRFIFEANAEASTKLRSTDFLPLHSVLKKRGRRRSSTKRISRFSGGSLEALLQGVWEALEDFQREDPSRNLGGGLDSIEVKLVRFDHDLPDDPDAGLSRNLLAEKLLHGCLGGLDEVIGDMELTFPATPEEAGQHQGQWSRKVPVELDLGFHEEDRITYGRSRAKPSVTFEVIVRGVNGTIVKKKFKWAFHPAQAERVRYDCVKTVLERWSGTDRILPVFKVPPEIITALHYAADKDEANRLIAQALTELEVVDLLEDMEISRLDGELRASLYEFMTAYRRWLDAVVEHGYFTAQRQHLPKMVNLYCGMSQATLDPEKTGSSELLPRFYKAFLLVDRELRPNESFLPGAVAWGLTPAVAELAQAQARFLVEGFPEAVSELGSRPKAKAEFLRLLELARIHRPIAGLIADRNQRLSAKIKSFDLVHVLGPIPRDRFSLAVQALLQESPDEGEDTDREITLPREEQEIVRRTLEDYQRLYPFAQDGVRILAVNVEELGAIISGVDAFLKGYLEGSSPDWPAFECDLMVYSTSSSPVAVEGKLGRWRNYVLERRTENHRALLINVAHRYAPDTRSILSTVKKERRVYDVAFLFHFLRSGLAGRIDPAEAFEFHFDSWKGVQFPITEYPRPIKKGEPTVRQIRISNRRFRIQSCHSNLTARLRSRGDTHQEHVVFGVVDYEKWSGVVNALHKKSQWVACVDPFVDKRLLCVDGECEARKIVGFSSGLGAFGELNLTISTEKDTLEQLTARVAGELNRLLPFEDDEKLEPMAARIVGESEEVIGLSSLRAVVGDGEQIREVAGFAAIRRILAVPENSKMSQLVPLDSLSHWFRDADGALRPDLLQLSLELRPGDVPLIHAVLVECKLAEENSVHVRKAFSQITEGLSHLTGLLAPDHEGLGRRSFDRRYWWGQLHRAITTRSVVDLSDSEWEELDNALEKLTEGQFEIRWQAAIFTFWTNVPSKELVVKRVALPTEVVQPPFVVPRNFAIEHIALGYEGLSGIFSEAKSSPVIHHLVGPKIVLRPQDSEEPHLVAPPAPHGEAEQHGVPELVEELNAVFLIAE